MLLVLAGRLCSEVIVLNNDGAWNWLQGERAVVVHDQLIVGSVAMGRQEPDREGDIEVTSYNLKTGKIARATLHHETSPIQRGRWRDDHSSPALAVRPDGYLVAMYCTHAQAAVFHHRISLRAGDVSDWTEERTFAIDAGSRVAFPQLTLAESKSGPQGKLLLFFRGLENRGMPSLAHSDDGGVSWAVDGVFLQLSAKVTPYVKYASDEHGTVHLAFTDGHRVDFNNGVFHATYHDGQFWRSNGERIAAFAEGISSTRQPTEIFRANPDSVAMISDMALDSNGQPHVVYSVQINTRPLRPRPIGADHRYRYARWDGRVWLDREIAFAGTETHAAPDDDCTGLAAIDPQDVSVVYISTNADPVTGAPLMSAADHQRHWEIFQGITRDGGARWTWKPITRDSRFDNLRPVVPRGAVRPSPVVWLRGAMRMPKDSGLEVVTLANAP
jgi:hypothetical protein